MRQETRISSRASAQTGSQVGTVNGVGDTARKDFSPSFISVGHMHNVDKELEEF